MRRQRRVKPKQRQRGRHLDQRRDFGVGPEVALCQDPVPVIQVMCLVPVGGIETRNVSQLPGEDSKQQRRRDPMHLR